MYLLKKWANHFYLLVFGTIAVYSIAAYGFDFQKAGEMFHSAAFYFPVVAMLAVFSGQIDLLISIVQGQEVNIKARMYDFIHWLMLIGINMGAWMLGGVTIWWFFLKLMLLAVIGWQIGIGVTSRLALTSKEKIGGVIGAVSAFILGLLAGLVRAADQDFLGWGWFFEVVTAIVATLIVAKWIMLDIRTIREKTALAYPRSFFLKGIFCNLLLFLFWLHVMNSGEVEGPEWWLRNAGLTFNVIVGNVIYLAYWLLYERERARQSSLEVSS